MAQNNKLIVMIATLLFSAIGYVIIQFISDIIQDQAAQQSGIIGDFLDFLTTNIGILAGLIWLLLCIIVYFGVRMVIDESESIGPISLYFLLIWLGAVIGLVTGYIVWELITDPSGVSLNADLLLNSIALTLTTALGPSFAAALGIATK